MKLNKKGFTLIELLAVIAILAILVVIAVPNILKLFNESKQSAFITQAQSIYKAAEEKVITSQLQSPGTAINMLYSGGTDAQKLDLTATSSVKYCIEITDGKVSEFTVSDGTYYYTNTAITSINEISASSSTNFGQGKEVTGCTLSSGEVTETLE